MQAAGGSAALSSPAGAQGSLGWGLPQLLPLPWRPPTRHPQLQLQGCPRPALTTLGSRWKKRGARPVAAASAIARSCFPGAGRRTLPASRGRSSGAASLQAAAPGRVRLPSSPASRLFYLCGWLRDCNSHRSRPAGEDGNRRAMPLEGEGKGCRGAPPQSKEASAGNGARRGIENAGFTRPWRLAYWGKCPQPPFWAALDHMYTSSFCTRGKTPEPGCINQVGLLRDLSGSTDSPSAKTRRFPSGPGGGDREQSARTEKGTPNRPRSASPFSPRAGAEPRLASLLRLLLARFRGEGRGAEPGAVPG